MASIEIRIAEQFDQIDSYLGRGDEFLASRKDSVSGWSVAEQLDHVTKVCEHILKGILNGKELGGKGITLVGRIVSLTGYIPRGAAKSPNRVAGTPETAANLRERLSRLRGLLEDYRKVSGTLAQNEKVIPHPFFRNLTRPQALRFMGIHSHHHLKIIRDIIS